MVFSGLHFQQIDYQAVCLSFHILCYSVKRLRRISVHRSFIDQRFNKANLIIFFLTTYQGKKTALISEFLAKLDIKKDSKFSILLMCPFSKELQVIVKINLLLRAMNLLHYILEWVCNCDCFEPYVLREIHPNLHPHFTSFHNA